VDKPQVDLILFADEEQRLISLLERLCADAKGRAVFLIDRNGRLVATAGSTAGLDTTSLSSLVAGSIAATGSLAQLIGETGFTGLFLGGEESHLYIAIVEERLIAAVLFDRTTSVGLVRFRVTQIREEIARALADFADPGLGAGPGATGARAELAQITDEDIENLLSI
jgi:predicted regulator of Ras-like GTPase activity (Roadblock/LC7/MglB family)